MAEHTPLCKGCLCNTCTHDSGYCCDYLHNRLCYEDIGCPDYEPEETEGEDE